MPIIRRWEIIHLLVFLTSLFFTSCGSPAGPSDEYYIKNRIAFSSDMNGNLDLYTVKLDGSGLVRLTDCEKEGYDAASQAAWSSDGKYIAFLMIKTSSQNRYWAYNHLDLFYITPKGSHQHDLLKDFPLISFCWSDRAGQISLLNPFMVGPIVYPVLVVSSFDIESKELTVSMEIKKFFSADLIASLDWSINGELVYTWLSKIYLKAGLEDSSSIELAEGLYPKWSPDGNKIAFVLDGHIWIMNRDGGDKELLVEEGIQPDWSPDGQKIVFSVKSDDKYNISYYDFMTETIISVIDNGYNNIKPVFSPL